MFRRSLAITALAAAATACGSGIREVDVVPAPTPIRAVADSAAQLVSIAAHESDSATVRARVATIARTLVDARSLVQGARNAAVTAHSHVAIALRQGDWLRTAVAEEELGQDYARYWSIGRLKLDEARSLTQSAVAVADSALACAEAECAAERARRLHERVEAAAGAAREAESAVRVAMVHVR